MNGRVYDPQLARFMSADPNIQAPGNGQSFNRYSYVLNNPLSYTDPTGYWSLLGSIQHAWKSVWHSEVGRAVVSVAAAYFTAGYAASLTWGNEVIAGMAGGFSGSLVGSGGNLKAGLIGGLTGGVAGNISSIYGDTWNWERVGANSLVGGVGSELNGGQFKDGFKTNFAFSATTYAAVSMREYEWAESQKNPNNSSGESVGFRGIGGKMGGERQNCCDLEGNLLPMTGPGSPLGGWQGGRGRLFWMDYAPDSWQDHLVESFGGVHDFLNHPVWYDTNGNAKVLTGFGKFIGEGGFKSEVQQRYDVSVTGS